MQKDKITAIVLTCNSEKSVEKVIRSVQQVAAQVVVVDDFSSDKTIKIAKSLGCNVVQHRFENYSQQRNWAQKNAKLKPDDWVLHIDNDEIISAKLADSIRKASEEADGFLVKKLIYFMGKPIRFGYINPNWHLILYRAGKGYCEDRLYDQHFVVEGRTMALKGRLVDNQTSSLERWTAMHNKWSSLEAEEVVRNAKPGKRALNASLKGDRRMQKRWAKNNLYYRSPVLLRSLLFFIYSYIFRLGFLDGKTGLIFHFLEAGWFRFLVDAKIIEMQNK
jgi:glycosyltransferase involved in cell wall biosynthesis